jgi:precorrin-6A synthase
VRTISVVGIGAGDIEHVTMQAISTLNAVDVVFMMDKGDAKRGLADLRRQICDRYIDGSGYRVVTAADPERDRDAAGYAQAVAEWRAKRAELYERLIADELGEHDHGAFLAWGDPGIYDSTVHVLRQVLARGAVHFEMRVIPGISSIQALAARHQVSLTRTGRPVHITTGRRLAAQGFPGNADDVVVMLDAREAFGGVGDEVEIYWGAYVGTSDEILISGRIGDVAAKITAARSAARSEHGWIMDSYLLRRPGDEDDGRAGAGGGGRAGAGGGGRAGAGGGGRAGAGGGGRAGAREDARGDGDDGRAGDTGDGRADAAGGRE